MVSASERGDSDDVRRQLREGADVDGTSGRWGWTALIRAADNGHLEVTRLLLQSRAEVDKADIWGWTALIRAADSGHLEVTQLLLQSRAEVDKANDSGWTALIRAARNGHLEVTRLLLQSGADQTMRLTKESPFLGISCVGKTAEEIARQAGHREVADAIRQVSRNSFFQEFLIFKENTFVFFDVFK